MFEQKQKNKISCGTSGRCHEALQVVVTTEIFKAHFFILFYTYQRPA